MTGQKAESMRRSLLILGALVLLIVVAAGTSAGVLVHRTRVLQAQSKAFVDIAVPAIAASWNKEQLLDRATPALLGQISSADLAALPVLSSQLGALAEYQGATGKVNWLSLTGFGGPISASYVAKASFTNGVATFQFTLVKLAGRWMIDHFHIDSVVLGSPGPGLL